MKNYLIFKDEIKKFQDVADTIKAVEKIAASSIHFLKQKVASLNNYNNEVESLLNRISIFYNKKDSPLMQKNNSNKKALIIITGNKGLVGGLWHKLITAFLTSYKNYYPIVIGIRGKKYLEEESVIPVKFFNNIPDIPQKNEVEFITNYIFRRFKKGDFSKIDILYPHFVSIAYQEIGFVNFLPFNFESNSQKRQNNDGLPIFEPSKKHFFNILLKKYIEIFFYKIIIDAKLSELSARTVAMERAFTKTTDFLYKLKIDYLKERRSFITQKQLESFTAHKINKFR